MDAVTLSDSIVRTLQTGGDIGNAATLTQYERDRYVKNLGMMALVDGINTMFKDGNHATARAVPPAAEDTDFVAGDTLGTTSSAADYNREVRPEQLALGSKVKQFLRSAGMLGIHQLGPLKGKIAKFAMGVDSNVKNSSK
jgi:2-polyprenyl-6-methoxyphenol hydroxylase-like FAD-dependent oxidoreductase